MALDHLPHNSLARFFNALGPVGFFSANTCFLFLSGIVSALVYSSVQRKSGTLAGMKKASGRIADLYLVQILLFFTVALAGYLSVSFQHQYPHFYQNPDKYSWRGIVLLYQFQFFDILPLYCLFLALTPFAIRQFCRGRAWTILAPSALLWIAAQFGMTRLPSTADGPLFFLNPFAFQAVFFGGLYFGSRNYCRAEGGEAGSGSRILFWSCAAICGVCFVLRMSLAFGYFATPYIEQHPQLVDLRNQGPLRIINFAAWAYVVWKLEPKLPKFLHENPIYRWLAFLGQHSLQVFAWTVLFALGCSMFRPAHVSRPAGMIETILSVATLVIPAWLHREHQRNWPILSRIPEMILSAFPLKPSAAVASSTSRQ